MRRGPLTLFLVLLLPLAGCVRLPGSAPAITDDWPALAEPTGWEPAVGGCHQEATTTLTRSADGLLQCTQWHKAETVHVGQVVGGSETAPPAVESPPYRKAWAECDAKTSEYLGGPWRDRRIRIDIAFPQRATWDGGARWFACLASVRERVVGPVIRVNFGLKAKFDSQPELVHGCAQIAGGAGSGDWTERRCDEAHNTEFVGNFAWSGSREEAKTQLQGDGILHPRCRELVSAFAGATVNTGTYAWIPGEADWEAGDTSVRCFLWLEDKLVSRSLKGVGRAGWPLR